MEVAFEIAGWFGTVIVVVAYLAVSMGWLKPGRIFQTANLIGSCTFIINGIYHGAWPSVTANVAWLVIAVIALLRAGLAPVREACLPGVAALTDGAGLPDPQRAGTPDTELSAERTEHKQQ